MATISLPAVREPRPRRRFRYPAANLALLPAAVDRGRRLSRLHAVDGAAVLHQLEAAAQARLRRAGSIPAPVRERALHRLGREHRRVRRAVLRRAPWSLGFLLAVFIDQRVRGEAPFRTIFLFPYSMSFVVTGPRLAVVPQPDARAGEAGPRPGLRELHLRLDREPADGDLHAGDRRPVARLRAGHGDPARRPARHRRRPVEGRRASTASRPGGSTSRSCCRCSGR